MGRLIHSPEDYESAYADNPHEGGPPLIMDRGTGNTYVGHDGWYHVDLRDVHGLDWVSQDEGRFSPDRSKFFWYKATDDPQDQLKQHFPDLEIYRPSSDKGQGWLTEYESVMRNQTPPQNLQQDAFDDLWTAKTAAAVMHVPGRYHKGIIDDHGEVHIWPLEDDPDWGEDPDAHPFHDEYQRDFQVQATPENSTRFYLDRNNGLRLYPKPFKEEPFYAVHDPQTAEEIVRQHVPDAHYTTDPYPDPESLNSVFGKRGRVSNDGSADEVHVALDVPERVRLSIYNFATSLGIPDNELEDPNNYHITVAYAEHGVENVPAHAIRNNFNMQGLKFEGVGLSKFDGGALVIELDNPYFSTWAERLADWLEENYDVEVSRFPGGPKPHITIAYTDKGVGYRIPPISFRAGPISLSTPRKAKPIPPVYAKRGRVSVEHPLTGEPMDEPDGGWEAWGGEPEWNHALRCPYCGSPNTGTKMTNFGHGEWKIAASCRDCFARWTPEQDKPLHQTGEDDPTWQDFWRGARTAGPNSYYAQPEYIQPRIDQKWQPGSWGKGLFIDHSDWPQPQVITWNTGTKSLNGGTPHHVNVSDHVGLDNDLFFEGLRSGSVRLLQIDDTGQTWDCFNGRELPPHLWEYAKAQGHGIRPYGSGAQEDPATATDDLEGDTHLWG